MSSCTDDRSCEGTVVLGATVEHLAPSPVSGTTHLVLSPLPPSRTLQELYKSTLVQVWTRGCAQNFQTVVCVHSKPRTQSGFGRDAVFLCAQSTWARYSKPPYYEVCIKEMRSESLAVTEKGRMVVSMLSLCCCVFVLFEVLSTSLVFVDLLLSCVLSR